MPLVFNEAKEPIGFQCPCEKKVELKRLDKEISLVGPPGEANPRVTVMICPLCQYCEMYYGTP